MNLYDKSEIFFIGKKNKKKKNRCTDPKLFVLRPGGRPKRSNRTVIYLFIIIMIFFIDKNRQQIKCTVHLIINYIT